MAAARYTVLIPTHDELGQPLNVAEAAYSHLTDEHRQIERATIHPGNPYDALVAWAEETPETDSVMKQLGVFIAEVCNVPLITVTREGKTGTTWHMRNKHYRLGDGADPSAISRDLLYGIDSYTTDHNPGSETQTPHAPEPADLPSSHHIQDKEFVG